MISLGTLPPMMPTILLSSLRFPHPARSEPLKLLRMSLPRPLRIMAASGLRGGGRFHQSQKLHYITRKDLHSRDPLQDDWPLSGDALAGSGGVLRMLPDRRPITTFEGKHVHAGTRESLTSGGCMRLQRD